MSEEKKQKSDEIKEFGALMLNENKKNYKISWGFFKFAPVPARRGAGEGSAHAV